MSGPNNNAINEKLDWLIKILRGLNKKIKNCNNTQETLTPFSVSSQPGDACNFPLGLPFTVTLYHDGVSGGLPFPVNGDRVYTDANGTIPYNGSCGSVYEAANGTPIFTNNGVYDNTVVCDCR